MKKTTTLLVISIIILNAYNFNCLTHANKCETLREHVKKIKTLHPNG